MRYVILKSGWECTSHPYPHIVLLRCVFSSKFPILFSLYSPNISSAFGKINDPKFDVHHLRIMVLTHKKQNLCTICTLYPKNCRQLHKYKNAKTISRKTLANHVDKKII